ncbi:MAG: aminotransferase class I/II-fold pyridoxal phosphate-dependent enzyme, partial [Gammaproteobacteria bacterium]
ESDETTIIFLANPNNPTGAVYSEEMLKALAKLASHHSLLIYSDEIYDKILFDGNKHKSIANYTDELVVTFSGLSKNYRVAGFRVGWMMISGETDQASDYINGINILASMRLCANMPMQHAVQTALGGYQSILDLTKESGRLYQQMDYAYSRINSIDGLSCVRPKGAMYLFPKIDTALFGIKDDEQFVLDLLMAKHILIVHGKAFNWSEPDHFRLVFLPHMETLESALDNLADFLSSYRQS